METLQKTLGGSGISAVSNLSMFGEGLFLIVMIGMPYCAMTSRWGRGSALA